MSENWNYEVAFNYGQFEEDTIVRGNMDLQRFGLAMDAARNTRRPDRLPLADRSRQRLSPTTTPFSCPVDTLAADIAACVPLNPFGEGSISQAARDFVLQDTTSVGQIKQ